MKKLLDLGKTYLRRFSNLLSLLIGITIVIYLIPVYLLLLLQKIVSWDFNGFKDMLLFSKESLKLTWYSLKEYFDTSNNIIIKIKSTTKVKNTITNEEVSYEEEKTIG